jgi:hypothetical protein
MMGATNCRCRCHIGTQWRRRNQSLVFVRLRYERFKCAKISARRIKLSSRPPRTLINAKGAFTTPRRSSDIDYSNILSRGIKFYDENFNLQPLMATKAEMLITIFRIIKISLSPPRLRLLDKPIVEHRRGKKSARGACLD